jgi:hypothetical protein
MASNNRVRDNSNEPKRIPLHEQKKNLLNVPPRPGFVRRLVNDVDQGQRVAAFLRAGYRIVEDETRIGDVGVENQNQSLGTGVRKFVGAGVSSVLMEIEEHLYNEDQAAKMDKLDAIEASIFRGDGVDGKYGSISREDGFAQTKRKKK